MAKPNLNVNQAKSTDYSYPDQFASNSEKDNKKWGLEYFRAAYNDNEKGDYRSSQESREKRWKISRKYAEGLQSIQKYKQLLETPGDTSFLNLDWNSVSVIPKYLDVMIGIFMNHDYKVQCTAIDPTSLTDKDNLRKKTLVNMDLKEFDAQMRENFNVPVIPEGEFVPETSEEAEVYNQMNVKLATEISMEEAIEFINHLNRYPEILRRVIRDFLVLKFAAVKEYYDEDHNIKREYVDPVNCVIPHSNYPDFRDITHFGERKKFTISELRTMMLEYSEEDFFTIAKTYAGRNGNHHTAERDSYYDSGSGEANGNQQYDQFKVDVLEMDVITTHTYKYVEKKNKYGGFFFEKVSDTYKPKKGQNIVSRDIQVTYEGKWIIGSSYLADWKVVEDMVRDRIEGTYSTKSQTRYTIYAPNILNTENKSHVERMIPYADMLQVTHLKMQHLIAKARPPGIAVDVSAMSAVMKGMGKGGGKMTPKDIHRLYEATGTYYFSSRREDGEPIYNSQPVQELNNGIGRDFGLLMNAHNFYVDAIRGVTGINEAVDASTPDKDALVGIQKMAANATNHSLRPIKEALYSVIERSTKRCVSMIQDSVESGYQLSGWFAAIGEESVKTIKLTSDVALADYGIKIKARPDEEEKEIIEQNIAVELQQGNLRIEDAIMLRREAAENPKYAAQLMVIRRKSYQKERQEEAAAAAQANAEQQMQSAQMAAQMKQQEMVLQAQLKEKEIQAKLQADLTLEQLKHDNKMKEIVLTSDEKEDQIMLAGQMSMDKTESGNEAMPQPRVFSNPGAMPTV